MACDVSNPLVGRQGASRIFGPQKGATPEMVETLDQALSRYAEVIEQKLDVEVKDLPGAGAAGGLGAAFSGSLSVCRLLWVDRPSESSVSQLCTQIPASPTK